MEKIAKIITILSGVILLIDFISIMGGASLTTFGFVTGLINFFILQWGCGYLEF